MPTIYPSLAGHDGYIQNISALGASWNSTHDATAGTTADSNDTETKKAIGVWCTTGRSGSTYYIYRSFLIFSTSGISVAPSAATLKIYGYSSDSGDVIAIEGTWTGAGAFTTDTFDNFTGFTSGWDDGDVTAYSPEVATWSTSGYNDFTLNATAKAKMVSANTLSVVLMNHTYDYLDATPLSGRSCNTEQNGMYWVDHSTASYRPYIDYTSGGYVNDTLGQDMDDRASKVIGVSSEDVKRVSGA